jgi:hypothetical protein
LAVRRQIRILLIPSRDGVQAKRYPKQAEKSNRQAVIAENFKQRAKIFPPWSALFAACGHQPPEYPPMMGNISPVM